MPRIKKIKNILRSAKKLKQQPGKEKEMFPQPEIENPDYLGSKKLQNKVAIITGGDSGIGHSVAIYFAKEGADIAIIYLNEHEDAQQVKREIERLGRKCLLIAGDIGKEKFCDKAVKKTLKKFSKIDILVNNAAEQHPQADITSISEKQLIKTFKTNIFSYFYMIKFTLPHLGEGSAIINTASVTSYKGSAHLMDYSATKGAIIALTRSLSQAIIKQGIRVNAVAPGPIWTPLIPSTFNKKEIKEFGSNVPMGRPGQPKEVAPCYVFLASSDSSYMTGQTLHPNGGIIVNS